MFRPFTHDDAQAEMLAREWVSHPRWKGIKRPYTVNDVVKLRGTVQVEQ